MQNSQTLQANLDPKRSLHLDLLCNFSEIIRQGDYAIAKLRKLGYEVEVEHLRYSSEDGDNIYLSGRNGDEEKLQEYFKLRAAQELRVANKEVTIRDNYISPHGGMTTITVTTPDDDSFAADAVCSIEDVFCRREGRIICLQRIFNDMLTTYGFTEKEVKKAIFTNAYNAENIDFIPEGNTSVQHLAKVI